MLSGMMAVIRLNDDGSSIHSSCYYLVFYRVV